MKTPARASLNSPPVFDNPQNACPAGYLRIADMNFIYIYIYNIKSVKLLDNDITRFTPTKL